MVFFIFLRISFYDFKVRSPRPVAQRIIPKIVRKLIDSLKNIIPIKINNTVTTVFDKITKTDIDQFAR